SLVLVFGARDQISQQLASAGLQSEFDGATRITDAVTLNVVISEVGKIRAQIEGLFSSSLPNSPMYHASIHISSGNFVVARPIGVRNGKGSRCTGKVRRVAAADIQQLLALNHIILLHSVAGAPTGKLFIINDEK